MTYDPDLIVNVALVGSTLPIPKRLRVRIAKRSPFEYYLGTNDSEISVLRDCMYWNGRGSIPSFSRIVSREYLAFSLRYFFSDDTSGEPTSNSRA